jgi:uncharacterized protein (DUF362 family)
MQGNVHVEEFTSYAESVPRALEAAGAEALLAGESCVLIKPNLVNASPPPVTLPVEAAEAIVRFVRSCSDARIVIGEGSGDPRLPTAEAFAIHGYERIAGEQGVELVDLNDAPLVRKELPRCRVFPHIFLPALLWESFVISAAVLKAHSLAAATLTMKNMVGCAPPAHYQQGGYWRKGAFHAEMDEAVADLNRYRTPDLCLIDAAVGMTGNHLNGSLCDPPVGKIVTGTDPVAVDAAGAALLGIHWRDVGHLRLTHGELGDAEAGAAAVG